MATGKKNNQQKMRFLTLNIACAFGMCTHAYAQFPDKPIEVVVPYPPGASTDFIARSLQVPMAEGLGQSIVIENRGGAGGNIGASYVARSPGNGYRLLLSTNATVTINPHVYKKTGFDTLKDFKPVALLASGPLCLTVNGKLGVNTLAELIAKAKTSDLSFGSAGNGSPQHVAGELLNEAAGISMTHIPYRGIGPALTDLLGGSLPVMFSTCSAIMPHLNGTAIKLIAVTTQGRFSGLPQTPTIAETFPKFDASAWFALYAPKGTPDDVIAKLNTTVNAALATPSVRKALQENALTPVGGKPEVLQQITQNDLQRWGPVVKAKAILQD